MPWRRFSLSMLLPVLHSVLSWCTGCFTECHGDFFIVVLERLIGLIIFKSGSLDYSFRLDDVNIADCLLSVKKSVDTSQLSISLI